MTSPTPLAPAEIKPGIYFHLPEPVYHRIPALSYSGVKALSVSPAHYWLNAPWNQEEGEKDEKERYCLTRGSAWGKALLEGLEAFEAEYGTEFDKNAFEGLVTNDDIRGALEELGLKTTGNKAELIARLRESGDERPVMAEEQDKHERELEGKTLIKPQDYQAIHSMAEYLKKTGLWAEFQGAKGGASEVSLIWEDEELGCLCKCRFDRVKGEERPVDLKTFSNRRLRPVKQEVHHVFASMGYHVQGRFYLRGLEKVPRVFHDDRTGELAKFIPAPEKVPNEMVFWFLESKTLELIPERYAPDEVANVEAPGDITTGQIADLQIQTMAKLFVKFMAKGIKEPWQRVHQIQTFDPAYVPSYLFWEPTHASGR